MLQGLHFVPLFAMDEVPITVHMYNPFVADKDVQAFLSRYCSSVSAGVKMRGRFGIWNGKRRFLARLKVDPTAPGGLLHPPRSFAIGPDRGYLYYPGQPQYCCGCGSLGHTKEACSGQRCHLREAEDHAFADCQAPKTCSLCGSEEHLFQQCPSQKGTFASLFADDYEADSTLQASGQVGVVPGPSRLEWKEPEVQPRELVQHILKAAGETDGSSQVNEYLGTTQVEATWSGGQGQ